MVYQFISLVIALIAVASIFTAGKILLNRKWVPGFLRGCFGISLLFITFVVLLSAFDVSTYKSAKNQQAIATLSFHHKEGNYFQVEIQETDGESHKLDIVGQQWQLNAQMFKWSPILGEMGFRIGYRFSSIKGRFLELQTDRLHHEKSGEELNASEYIDVWEYLNQHQSAFFPDAYKSSPGFIPLADGAIFDVVLTGTNLAVNPLNEAAKSALASW
jgi:hypothetical protein